MSDKFEMVGRVSTGSVLKHTGKNWDQWVKLLDKVGAQNLTHQEIVLYLQKKFKLTVWWQQGVASGYEIAICRKVEGRNSKGQYATTSSKTFYIDVKELWKMICSDEGLGIWLKPMGPFKVAPKAVYESELGIYGQIRTMVKGERMRISWQDTDWDKPTILQVYLVPRPGKKSILIFMHDQIKDSRTKLSLKEHWKNVLNDLALLAKG